MVQFLLQGLDSIPTPEPIREALQRAGSADPRELTKAQAELARVLRRPDSNELVFQMVTAPMLAQGGEFWQQVFGNYFQAAFGKFQTQNPNSSFLEAIAAGLKPFTELLQD